MFCAPGLVFGGTEGVGSRFHVLHARTHFRRYRGRRVPFSCFAHLDSFSAVPRASGSIFSCFALPDSFSAVPRASGPVFISCAPELVFDSTEVVGSRFHVLRALTHFRPYRGRHFPLFIFCAPGLVFDGTEVVGSRFLVLHLRTNFRWYRGRHVLFSCFAPRDSFSAVPMASCPIFMFCAPELIFGGTEGVGYRFHVLHVRTRFQRYRGRRVTFSCFARPGSFSAVPRASGPVFIFCAHVLVFGGAECVGTRFPVLRPESFSAVTRASCPVFMFCEPGLIFGGTEGVGSRFDISRSRTSFRRYRWSRVPFLYFGLPD
jgi:hypothetical protein